jgi:hypothetical protein
MAAASFDSACRKFGGAFTDSVPELTDTDIAALPVSCYNDRVIPSAEIIKGRPLSAVGHPVFDTTEVDPLILNNMFCLNFLPAQGFIIPDVVLLIHFAFFFALINIVHNVPLCFYAPVLTDMQVCNLPDSIISDEPVVRLSGSFSR